MHCSPDRSSSGGGVVKDAGGQKLGYFYYDEEPGRRDGSGTAVKEKSSRQPAGQRIQSSNVSHGSSQKLVIQIFVIQI